MIFLDTCIWIELTSAQAPATRHEQQQAVAASALLSKLRENNETIITCNEQLIELISAIEKTTMRTANRLRKQNGQSGIGNLKQFRECPEFQDTKQLCSSAIEDLYQLAVISNICNYDINHILQRLELADINDFIYYDFCVENNIDFYTFDADLIKIGDTELLHKYDFSTETWSNI